MNDPSIERISFTDVRLGFGRGRSRVEVLDGVDFGVRSGEFVSVLGPSGCGKSTLLNLAAGFLQPESGLVEVDVIVLKYDPATERVSLGHKQLVQDPWATVEHRYPVGARMGGKVVSLTDYGAFVELEPGVEGLIHVSEMSWSKRVKHPSKILNVGDTVDAMVLGVDPVLTSGFPGSIVRTPSIVKL